MTRLLVALAVFIPVSGWVADRYGARRVFVRAIVVFTLASVLCGLASGLPQFVGARVLQGIGGAMMVPVGRLVVLRATRSRAAVGAIAWLTWPGLLAPVLGPPLGGLFTDACRLALDLLVNVPLGVLALPFALRIVPDLPADGAQPSRLGGLRAGGAGLAAWCWGWRGSGTCPPPGARARPGWAPRESLCW